MASPHPFPSFPFLPLVCLRLPSSPRASSWFSLTPLLLAVPLLSSSCYSSPILFFYSTFLLPPFYSFLLFPCPFLSPYLPLFSVPLPLLLSLLPSIPLFLNYPFFPFSSSLSLISSLSHSPSPSPQLPLPPCCRPRPPSLLGRVIPSKCEKIEWVVDEISILHLSALSPRFPFSLVRVS